MTAQQMARFVLTSSTCWRVCRPQDSCLGSRRLKDWPSDRSRSATIQSNSPRLSSILCPAMDRHLLAVQGASTLIDLTLGETKSCPYSTGTTWPLRKPARRSIEPSRGRCYEPALQSFEIEMSENAAAPLGYDGRSADTDQICDRRSPQAHVPYASTLLVSIFVYAVFSHPSSIESRLSYKDSAFPIVLWVSGVRTLQLHLHGPKRALYSSALSASAQPLLYNQEDTLPKIHQYYFSHRFGYPPMLTISDPYMP